MKTGFEMLGFLKAEFGRDVRMEEAQLWFLVARQSRADPARARPVLVSVLRTVDALEDEGRPNPYLRAQALLVLSVLRDRPTDRTGLDDAYDLFLEVSRRSRQMRLEALYYAAQTRQIVGHTFHEPAEVEKAVILLERIPQVAGKERLKISLRLRQQIEYLRSVCASR